MLFSAASRSMAFEVRIHEVAPGDEVRRDGAGW